MTFIVDSHCHLNYGDLANDLDGVLNRAAEAGVGTMLAINARLSEFNLGCHCAAGCESCTGG